MCSTLAVATEFQYCLLMRCPRCQQALQEHSHECAHCSFSLAEADRLYGIPPQVSPTLSDLADAISRKDERNILESLLEKHRLFPQLRFSVVLTRLSADVSLRAYTFWLFNRSGLATSMEKGGNCRVVLLAIDVATLRVACMVGYGLEPFVNDESLSRIVHAALPALRARDFTKSVLQGLDQAESEFSRVAQVVPQAYGLYEEAASQGGWDGREAMAF